MEIYKTTGEAKVIFKLLKCYHKQLGGEWKEFEKQVTFQQAEPSRVSQCLENAVLEKEMLRGQAGRV